MLEDPHTLGIEALARGGSAQPARGLLDRLLGEVERPQCMATNVRARTAVKRASASSGVVWVKRMMAGGS